MTASIVDRFTCEVEGHEWLLRDNPEWPVVRHAVCKQCGEEEKRHHDPWKT